MVCDVRPKSLKTFKGKVSVKRQLAGCWLESDGESSVYDVLNRGRKTYIISFSKLYGRRSPIVSPWSKWYFLTCVW